MKRDVFLIALVLLAAAVTVAAAGHGKSFGEFLGGEGEKIVEKLWIVVTTRDLYNFLAKVYDNLDVFILANPSIEAIKGFQGFMIKLIYPPFILAIVSTAAYLLFYSDSPKGRVKAKAVLIRLIYAMILVSLSPYITEGLLALSGTLTSMVFNLGNIAATKAVVKAGAENLFWLFAKLTMIHRTGGIDLLLLWETFLLIFNFALAARYLLVTFWFMLFPASLLFYTFTPTKSIGKKFIHQTLLWTFVQVGWAFAVVLVALSAVSMIDAMPDFPQGKIGIAGLLLMIATPMVILGLMDWLSLGVEVIEIINAAPLSVGALTIDEMKVERAVVREEPALEGV